MDETTIWILLGIGAITGLILGLFAIRWLILGAGALLAWAATQGFVGVAAYFALWIFALPLMLVASIVSGLVADIFTWAVASAERSAEREEKRVAAWREKYLGERPKSAAFSGRTPPSDPIERHKWANRLPPYDT